MNDFTIYLETTTPKEAVTTDAPDILSLAPDVLLTPRGADYEPVPYSAFADTSEGIGLSSNVRINSQKVFTRKAYIPFTQGGELGTGGGVRSCTQGGRTQPIWWPCSESVFINKNRVMRYFDIANMNEGNTVGEITLSVERTSSGEVLEYGIDGVPEPAGIIEAIDDTAKAYTETPTPESLAPFPIPEIETETNPAQSLDDAEPSTSEIPAPPEYTLPPTIPSNLNDNEDLLGFGTLADCMDIHNGWFRGGKILVIVVSTGIVIASLSNPTSATATIALLAFYADDTYANWNSINTGEDQDTFRASIAEKVAKKIGLNADEIEFAGDLADFSSAFAGGLDADSIIENGLANKVIQDLNTINDELSDIDPNSIPKDFLDMKNTRELPHYPGIMDELSNLKKYPNRLIEQEVHRREGSSIWMHPLLGKCALITVATPAHNVHVSK